MSLLTSLQGGRELALDDHCGTETTPAGAMLPTEGGAHNGGGSSSLFQSLLLVSGEETPSGAVYCSGRPAFTSHFRGVCYHRGNRRWRAEIRVRNQGPVVVRAWHSSCFWMEYPVKLAEFGAWIRVCGEVNPNHAKYFVCDMALYQILWTTVIALMSLVEEGQPLLRC